MTENLFVPPPLETFSLEEPIETSDNRIVTELPTLECFSVAVVDRLCGRDVLCAAWGINFRTYAAAVKYHLPKLPGLREVKSRRSHLTRNKSREERGRPEVVVPLASIQPYIDRRVPYDTAANELGLSTRNYVRNVEYWSGAGELYQSSLHRCSAESLAVVEELFGADLSASTYYDDPESYLENAYHLFLKLDDVLNATGSLGKSLDYWRSKKGREFLEHVTFSRVKSENAFARFLLRLGVPHARQFVFPGSRYTFDFKFDHLKVILELDGEYHDNCPATVERDAAKVALAEKNGFRIVRFPNNVAVTSPHTVLEALLDEN